VNQWRVKAPRGDRHKKNKGGFAFNARFVHRLAWFCAPSLRESLLAPGGWRLAAPGPWKLEMGDPAAADAGPRGRQKKSTDRQKIVSKSFYKKFDQKPKTDFFSILFITLLGVSR
jgi:hypothetical protein